MVLRKVTTPKTGPLSSIPAAGRIAFGAAIINNGTDLAVYASAADTDEILGFAVQPANNVVLRSDGFYQQYDDVPYANTGEVNALVIALGATNIIKGDFLEVAALGGAGGSGAWGVLAEAGNLAGATRTLTSVAQAMEAATLNTSNATPTAGVAIGDTTITMAAGAIATMGLVEGDYVILRDLDGDTQLNRVKSLTATVITLQIPSTVALTVADSDVVQRVAQIRVRIL
jgi:hypothetical protein